ncbi:MAG TPA: dihydrodipicolinate reductase C-terminal domain-containing protein [Gemmatimonadales bacterium]|nr:dihydrodipicolinate reductase C-terminal domain-containing protein [Gemmatimonadales bacterium]
MRLALFGRGAMGRAVAERARAGGLEIGAVFTSADAGRNGDQLVALLRGHDVAIDFSTADGVLPHVTACAGASVPLVEGTTGWRDREAAVREAVEKGGGALVYGANFSIGANLFFRLVTRAAELFGEGGPGDYEPFIEEAHHAQKRDAPSGSALRLRDILTGPAGWPGRPIGIASTRAGHIPGAHRVGFDSAADQIVLEHTARSREGFAAGALIAATWIVGRRGVFTFDEVLDDMLATVRR